jgi:hypothetical protein
MKNTTFNTVIQVLGLLVNLATLALTAYRIH